MSKLPISNEYPPDWPEINACVCAEAGHRCIRCGHPYVKGTRGKGEWSPCDARCTHDGPFGAVEVIGGPIKPLPDKVREQMRVCRSEWNVYAQWRILTVHHLDGDKANCQWWNLLPLCQRCHLTVQGNVNPQTPYFLEHSDWFKPYVAGFYAKKYEGRNITREEAIARMDELLAKERLA